VKLTHPLTHNSFGLNITAWPHSNSYSKTITMIKDCTDLFLTTVLPVSWRIWAFWKNKLLW